MNRIMTGVSILAVLGAATAGCNANRSLTEETTAREQSAQSLIVPAGTSVIATLDRQLSTETNRTGDPIDLTTVDPIVRDGRTVVPAGSVISGTLRNVEASGRAQMTLIFSSLTGPDGRVYVLNAMPLVLLAESGTGTDIERIAASGAIGEFIGDAVEVHEGATRSDGTDASPGVTVTLATQGEELILEPGQKIYITITSPMSVQVAARN